MSKKVYYISEIDYEFFIRVYPEVVKLPWSKLKGSIETYRRIEIDLENISKEYRQMLGIDYEDCLQKLKHHMYTTPLIYRYAFSETSYRKTKLGLSMWRKGWRSLLTAALLATVGGLLVAVVSKKFDDEPFLYLVLCINVFLFSAFLPMIIWGWRNWVYGSLLASIPYLISNYLYVKLKLDWIQQFDDDFLIISSCLMGLILLMFFGMGWGVPKQRLFARFGGTLFGALILFILLVVDGNIIENYIFFTLPAMGILLWESILCFDLLLGNASHHAYAKTMPNKKRTGPLNRFLSLLMPRWSIQGIVVLCFLTGLITLLTVILQRSESIINNKITSAIGRPEMIILPEPHFYKDKSDNNLSNRLPTTFAISKTEITNNQFIMVVGGIALKEPLQPVTNIKVSDAARYCNLLSELEGLDSCYEINELDIDCRHNCTGYRLPTHEEWEYAARADLDDFFWSVKSNLLAYGWFSENTQNIRDVATKTANPWGLYDMMGNVWEMVYFFEEGYYYICGGSYKDSVNIKKKNLVYFGDSYNNVGFRIVRSIFTDSDD